VQQQSSRHDKAAVVENCDVANRFRKRALALVQLTGAQVGHPHADEPATHENCTEEMEEFQQTVFHIVTPSPA
jgi:hypothetical protein